MATNVVRIPAPAPQSARDNQGRFLTANIGGPGRPKGSRNKLSEDFVAAVYEDWTEHGTAVLARVRETRPAAYLRIVAALCPVRVNIGTDAQIPEMTSAELLEDIFRDFERLGLVKRAPGGMLVIGR